MAFHQYKINDTLIGVSSKKDCPNTRHLLEMSILTLPASRLNEVYTDSIKINTKSET